MRKENRNRDIIKCFIEGMRQTDIAKRHSICVARVHQIIYKYEDLEMIKTVKRESRERTAKKYFNF